MAVALDVAGNAYITGTTYSTDFPVEKSYQQTHNGMADTFVVKVNTTGATLAYATYLGGGERDYGYGITVDGAGSAYVTVATFSHDFPTKAAFQENLGGGLSAFVAKLHPEGNSLNYSTYLGGSGGDVGADIVVDSQGKAYVTGSTGSPNFPTHSAVQWNFKGTRDAFVVRLNTSGNKGLGKD